MPFDDDDDDPTVVTHFEQVTPHQGVEFLPGYETGVRDGIQVAFAGMRVALLEVGVEAWMVEPILDRVRKRMR